MLIECSVTDRPAQAQNALAGLAMLGGSPVRDL
jgi:hypothetical protein